MAQESEKTKGILPMLDILKIPLKTETDAESVKKTEKTPEKPKKIKENSEKTEERVKRRSKRDLEGREFVCSCGKKYLSYPALYTHNKTKHDGNLPMTEKPKKVKTCEDAFNEFYSEKPELNQYFRTLDLFKMCLNERGFQMEKIPESGEYCAVRKPGSIPNMCNFFLLKYLKFKDEEIEFELARKAIETFCSWLFKKKYSDLEIEPFNSNNNKGN